MRHYDLNELLNLELAYKNDPKVMGLLTKYRYAVQQIKDLKQEVKILDADLEEHKSQFQAADRELSYWRATS